MRRPVFRNLFLASALLALTQLTMPTGAAAEARLAALSKRASAEQGAALQAGLRRLIDPAEMGNLFKVLALTSPGLPPPAGFEQSSPHAVSMNPA